MGRSSSTYLFSAAIVVGAFPAFLGGARSAAPFHLELRSSQPADGDTVVASPSSIRLEFSQAVEVATSSVTLTMSDGATVELTLSRDTDRHMVLYAAVPRPIPGSNRVTWRGLASDGHPASGQFSFYVTPPTTDTSVVEVSLPPVEPEASAVGFPLLPALFRAAASMLHLALAGMLFFLIRVGPSAQLTRGTRSVAGLAAGATIVHVLGWLWYAGFGGEPHAWLGILTGVGRAEGIRLVIVLITTGFVLGGASPRVTVAGALAVLLAGAGIGHAATFQATWSIPAKAVHLSGAAVWLGGLMTLVLGDREPERLARNARLVSSAALWAVIAVTATGITQAVLIASPAALFGSRYGLVLAAKTVGLVALVSFGAYHRLRLVPNADTAEHGGRLRESVAQEIMVFGIVVLIAGVLGYMMPPE